MPGGFARGYVLPESVEAVDEERHRKGDVCAAEEGGEEEAFGADVRDEEFVREEPLHALVNDEDPT